MLFVPAFRLLLPAARSGPLGIRRVSGRRVLRSPSALPLMIRAKSSGNDRDSLGGDALLRVSLGQVELLLRECTHSPPPASHAPHTPQAPPHSPSVLPSDLRAPSILDSACSLPSPSRLAQHNPQAPCFSRRYTWFSFSRHPPFPSGTSRLPAQRLGHRKCTCKSERRVSLWPTRRSPGLRVW
jgi:hypothetical protein